MNGSLLPFHTFLWKVASRCNINCTYCYVYNLADQSWRNQPAFMSDGIAIRAATRIREHLEAHNKTDVSIVLHGGEPLLLGVTGLKRIVGIIRDTFRDSGVAIHIGMQSNLLLFDEEIGDFLLGEGMSIGVSIDGPPEVHDLFRLDHAGRGTSAQLEQKLALLTQPEYVKLFAGFLCVVNPEADPVRTVDYLLGFKPRMIDFLLPLNNHDSRPTRKPAGREHATPYGDWLINTFDRWISSGSETRIRYFNSMIQMIFGASTSVESLGLLPVDLVVVETNGDIEGVDSLKSAFEGAPRLGFSVLRDTFDTVATDMAVRTRQLGLDGLCTTCQTCDVVGVCGGGYYPHRYSKANGFQNPSVYCSDIMKLARHVDRTVRSALAADVMQVDEAGSRSLADHA